MGNTRIQDSATGNVMSLNPGFIPVGMKEHGGIMYIASVNKDGEGEIGTIPSPIIRDVYKDKISIPFDDTIIPIDSGDPIQITNKLYPTDKFIANLQMSIDPKNLKGILHTKNSGLSGPDGDPCDIVLERQICSGFKPDKTANSVSLYSPVISYSVNSADQVQIDGSKSVNIRKKGIYKLNLYSTPEQGKSILAGDNLLSSQVYGTNGENKSQYWFLHTDSPTSVFPKDLFNATLNKDLKQVPVSNKPGKLAVKLIPESITDFGMLPRADALFVPITYKTNEGKYYTYFSGFYYTSDSGLYIEKLTARVIDESTNSKVDLVYPYERQEIPLFNKYDLSDLSYNTSVNDDYTDLFLNGGLKLWNVTDTSGLPHSRSNTSSNTQILSPIAGLFNHEKTSFKSSTQGKDDSPHSGVFYADLGGKYQNWYILEVDYEDQYGGNKGTFTTRFNPYINDVFGTNLNINSLDKYPCLQMGGIEIVPEQTYEYRPKDTSYTISYKMQIGKHLNTNKFNLNQRGCVPSTESSESQQEFGKLSLVSPDSVLFTLQSTSADLNKSKNYHYLYSGSLHPTTDGMSIEGLRFNQNDQSFISKSSNNSIPSKLLSYNDNSYDFSREVRTQRTIFTKDWKFKIDNDEKTCQAQTYWALNTWHLKYKPTNNDYPFSDTFSAPIDRITFDAPDYHNNYVLNQILELNNINDLPQTITALSDKFYYQASKTSSDIQYCEDINVFPNHPVIMLQYELTEGSDPLFLVFNFSYELSPITVKTNSYQLNPSYSIVPYFILQGNKGIKVPGQRFGKLQDTDIVYEHNFESNEDGVINYIKQSEQEQKTTSPCSYNEQNPFKYLKDDFTFEDSRDAGIYVLNIQRCPGVGNWTQKGADTALINLDISIGENNIYSYNPAGGDNTIQNWSVNVSDTNKCTYKTTHGETSNMRIYTPIVLVIPNNSNVKIDIKPIANHNFNRQSIGLYKIRDVGQEDIANELKLQESVYLYHDYMKLIQNKSASLDTVKQYAFIQKYGVFFKEAFVFVDGLCKDGQVNSVTIGEKTYQPYPYIPSDPSILPVSLGEDGNYYWNTYYMPEEVLTSDDCEFIFSNDDGLSHIINSDFKSVKSGNLRQLINQE